MKKLIKRTYKSAFIILALAILLAIKFAGSTGYALSSRPFLTNNLQIVAAANHCARSFLGLEAWFNYLPDGDFYPTPKTTPGQVPPPENCDIKCFNLLSQGTAGANICGETSSDLPLVLLAIIDDLLRVAGLAIFGIVLYGAFLFVTSQGNSEAAAKARTTIINALIGLTVAVIAITVVSFLGNILSTNTATLNPSGSQIAIQPGNLPLTKANSTSIQTILQTVFESLGALAVLIIVIGGFRYIVSSGDPQKTAQARNTILFALIGLVIALTASAIIGFVGGRL